MEAPMAQRKSLIGFWNNRKGSSFIETAILFPVILLLSTGIMDFARVVYSGIEVANAARAGVQFGALTPGNSGDMNGMVQAAMNDAADLGLTGVTATARNFCECNSGTGEVPCSSTTCGVTPSGYVSVTAHYTYNLLAPWPGLPRSIVLTRTADMRAQ
jgi:Flp pilus assembly protein TadG